MILTKHKLAFVHAQKTAGTSVLGMWVDDEQLLEHKADFALWRRLNEDELWKRGVVLPSASLHHTLMRTRMDIKALGYEPDEFTYFTITRNPWDALRSAHRYHVKRGLLRDDATFMPTMHSAMIRFYADVAKQADKFRFVLRFETLENDLLGMLYDLQITPPHPLRVCNATNKDLVLNYSPLDVQMLQGVLGPYCERFNYSPLPDAHVCK